MAALQPLPAVPLEACEKRAASVSSTALMRYRTNDYSVPTAYGFRDVVVKGFVDEVVISCVGEEIGRHARCYSKGVFVSNPLHYLAVIETKPGALDQAAALQDWNLPDISSTCAICSRPGWATSLSRAGSRGKREFIQVLQLLEAMPLPIVTDAGDRGGPVGRARL